MKVYITKYWESTGIIEKDAEVCTGINTNMVRNLDPNDKWQPAYHKPYWHTSKEEAVKHAEELKAKRIKNLKAKILKLEKQSFI